jgi:hypothetical protein
MHKSRSQLAIPILFFSCRIDSVFLVFLEAYVRVRIEFHSYAAEGERNEVWKVNQTFRREMNWFCEPYDHNSELRKRLDDLLLNLITSCIANELYG